MVTITQGWTGYIFRHEAHLQNEKDGKTTCGMTRTELLHDMTENRAYTQLQDSVLDRMAWNKKSSISLS